MFDYNNFYNKFGVDVHFDPVRFEQISKLCCGRVLDIGCGTGTLSDFYSGDYTGIDISDVAIKMAKESRRKDAIFSVCDVCNDSFLAGQKFDTIVMAEFLEHINDDYELFKSISLFLKNYNFSTNILIGEGTRLIISVPNGNAIPDESHVRTFTIPELRKKFAPFGRVQFYNWPGAQARIIMTCDVGVPADDKISLVMIVKNEAVGLPRAILSVLPYVQNIVIAVDDKSNDKTLEIAKQYADDVKVFTWRDSFSWARNFAQSDVKTPWVLSLDGHEYIEKCEKLNDFLNLDCDALLCTLELESGMLFRYPRIYRRDVSYEGEVHNELTPKKPIFYPDILITHGRTRNQSADSIAEREKQRSDMVPRIMKKQLKENSKNIRASFHLALHYQAKSDWKNALKYQSLYLKYSTKKAERWYVLFNRSLCWLALGKKFMAFWCASFLDDELPGRWETARLKGLILFDSKKYDQAIENFLNAFTPNIHEHLYCPWKFDDVGIWGLVGESFYYSGNLFKAAIAFNRASETATDEKVKQFYRMRKDLLISICKETKQL